MVSKSLHSLSQTFAQHMRKAIFGWIFCIGRVQVVYLLEKSRLTYQQPLERCYHAFYNLMSDEVKDLKVLEQD